MTGSTGFMRPYCVAAFFMDPTNGRAIHVNRAVSAVSADHATGQAVSAYYTEMGGRLPLMATAVIEISRDTLEKGIAMLDAIDAADQAEADKVVGLRALPEPEQRLASHQKIQPAPLEARAGMPGVSVRGPWNCICGTQSGLHSYECQVANQSNLPN